jgi:nicotinate (nicotinamide) nucleotide adenylyltransferase
MKIGIFGGSFNPVHSGHVGIVKKAVQTLDLDRCIVVPAYLNPFKADVANAKFSSCDRLLLVRAAFNGMEKVVVDNREIVRGGISYAIDTVREIAAENPGAELYFITGEDIADEIDSWKDAGELKKLCSFVSFPRTAESSSAVRSGGKESLDALPEQVRLFIEHSVSYNDDAKIVNAILNGLERKKGYCPCRVQSLPEFFCPCDEFRAQLKDPEFEGLCHCRLYKKGKDIS